MPFLLREDEGSLASLVLEIRRVALELQRFGMHATDGRPHPELAAMGEHFETIANTLAEGTEAGSLGVEGLRTIAASFHEVGNLVEGSAKNAG
jgi:hypothetical protein